MADNNCKPTSQKAYKIVLAGDAAVGKSSFLMRLCKNEFQGNTSATLGRTLISLDNRRITIYSLISSLPELYTQTHRIRNLCIYPCIQTFCVCVYALVVELSFIFTKI